jgi:uncharacterized protein YdaU (DUF1376 family)
MAKSLPMLPWWPRDFAASTPGWSILERGLFRELLDLQWEMGALPRDESRLSKIVRAGPGEFRRAWPLVKTKFVETDAGLLNEKLEEHRAEAMARRERHALGARMTNLRRERPGISTRGGAASATLSEAPQSLSPSPSPTHSPSMGERASERLPPKLTDEMRGDCRRTLPDADVDAMYEQFKTYYLAKGEAQRDWQRLWDGWIQKSVSGYSYPKQRPRTSKTYPEFR